MMPTECPECERLFKMSVAWQAEARHIAAKEGARAAEDFVNLALQEYHAEHG